MITGITMRFHQEFDVTDSILKTLKEEGRDTAAVSDEEIERMVLYEFEDYDFNKSAALSMQVLVSRESPSMTAQRVLRTVFEHSKSFEEDRVGSELAYIALTILESKPDDQKVTTWDLTGASGEDHAGICDMFRECFDEDDPVWNYIEIREP